jgi:hypothetical protein
MRRVCETSVEPACACVCTYVYVRVSARVGTWVYVCVRLVYDCKSVCVYVCVRVCACEEEGALDLIFNRLEILRLLQIVMR